MGATMAKGSSPLQPLAGAQALAAAPDAHVWLSASAGTGKTHVLTARVFRLLLQGVRPENILCLTFTKAATTTLRPPCRPSILPRRSGSSSCRDRCRCPVR